MYISYDTDYFKYNIISRDIQFTSKIVGICWILSVRQELSYLQEILEMQR